MWQLIFRHLDILEYIPLSRVCKFAQEAARRRSLEQLSTQDLYYAVFSQSQCMVLHDI